MAALLPNGLPFGVVVLGVVIGSVQALTAMGLVLLYRSSRIINFAQAEIGGLAASAAVIAVVGFGLPYVVAVVLGLVVAGLTGAIVDATIIRRLFTAPRLILTVATIGLAQVLGAVQIELPRLFHHLDAFTTFHAPFTFEQRIGPLVFGADHLIAVVASVLAGIGLWWFLARTDAGIGIRAAADSQERAALLGVPIRSLSRTTWVVAALLSGLGAMLSAPIVGANVGVAAGPTVLLVPLAAAVVGRMEHLGRTAAAAVAISVFQQAVFWSYPRSSTVDVAVFALVLVALLLQRRTRRRDDDVTELGGFVATQQAPALRDAVRDLPEMRAARWGVIVVGALVVAAALLTFDDSRLVVLAYMAIYGIVAISLVVLTGWAGQISLGQFAFVAVGSGVTAGLYVNAGVDLFVALAIAIVVGGATAVLIGAPALRLPGLMLAVATLAFAVPVSTWLLNPDHVPALTPSVIPRPELFGVLSLSSPRTFAAVCIVAVGVVWVLAANLRRSRAGRAILAVRDNERAAAAYGIDPVRTRLVAFAAAGAVCGLAGGLYAIALRGIGFGGFDPAESVQTFTMVVVGGLASLNTAVLGAVYVRGAQELLDGPAQLLATGAGLLVLVLFLPGGIGSVATAGRDRLARWAARRHGLDGEAPAVASVDGVETATTTSTIAPDEDVLLDVRDVDAGYGGVRVLFRVSLQVRRGEVLALLGTNGAGKSTLLRAIAGTLATSGGHIELAGHELGGLDAVGRARAGIALMPGGRAVFPSLTVEENLRIGAWLGRDDPAGHEALDAVLASFPVLAEHRARRAGLLSGGQQQMLGLAQSLLARPELLLIDELSLGLAPAVVAHLLDVVRELNRQGTTVVLVEQSLNVAASIAERAVFLERGRVRFEGPTAELVERDDLARAVFLGAPPAATRAKRARVATVAAREARPTTNGHGAPQPAPEPELRTRGLTVRFGGNDALRDVDLDVDAHEVVGIIGSNGAGKTTLLDACSGFVDIARGTVSLAGDDITTLAASGRAARRLGRSFQGARLFPALTVSETLAVALERHIDVRDPFACALWLPATRRSERDVARRVDELVEQLRLGDHRRTAIGALSTGTRRIVELGCAMAHQPSVLLLDEPSSGVAQREVEALADVLLELRRDLDASFVVVEHDIPLVTALADRLVCLHLGQVLAVGAAADVLADPAVVASYLGRDDVAVSRSGPTRARSPRRAAVASTGPSPSPSPGRRRRGPKE